MSCLKNKKILLGVTGGIAAYKSAVLLRGLLKEGAEVRVVMTAAARSFVTPLTFQALSGHPVHTELLDPEQESAMDHISLARWADLVLVAPATANFMAKLATGQADDLLTTLCLATTAPISIAPAMNHQMWLNGATQENLEKLCARGVICWGPAEGDQACGENGPGRMVEPELLLQQVQHFFTQGTLSGVRVLMTAGSTREPIDPVRFIGNRSSGKMGFALAQALSEQGAEVTLVSGPATVSPPMGITRIDVEQADEMRREVINRAADADIFIGVAAVADYRPRQVASEKIKKDRELVTLELVKNPDILAEVAGLDGAPFCVGFAAETENVEAYAEAKRQAKGLDLIAANQVATKEGGFESDQNALLLLWQGGREVLPMMSKHQLAKQLVERISEQYHASR
ncbi:MAG: bifunctional phosphopantothenoylcysteine decarboxylase/phosphopantothenate--cysteine ligase CoaBC [Candidatus Thiodiazotropha lotti]|uniref:Coenzyme A biosynthesis bifunctional protein CoaBC n=1 Tax=Candidatus Thiodiazotropha lotti TaxID=2792787 RepID=A0A9E4K473_9GAMM|nr:bifunctional phosphopantothenoylcysteine decarboxylase/phosphopantothenate--cysteine ligase CoaBC [Candidatus Thiodiazotropha lotti]ODC00318.1 phosphopantothenoylcysteine decarboxylase [Candidatus Thiodiazotropha endoloripes]MCG7922534.1 bifunctional phosphopantothenoylcysteine decarboxylase/phosphopantothenate--cysteine ligase CoaBC [Candidatus Thiodiazotropha lotti]MCG7930879.1 bifunctional phosphopantothenoylcysteine decarboxylase/phosphopantothenate--cysteine ligase CoaBC [Candidatus Thio